MERILIGLPDFAIEKALSPSPVVLQVKWTGMPTCPDCGSPKLRTKDTFIRSIKSFAIHGKSVTLQVKCHKYMCFECGRYFNTRLAGVKKWCRVTEKLKSSVFDMYNKGVSCKDIAEENQIGVASVERYYQHMIIHNHGHQQGRECPRVLGIDEHRFTRKVGFLTTF